MDQEKKQKQILKLQKEIADFQKQLTIQAKEKDLIKTYVMKQGDYQILITIYEANDLCPKQEKLLFWDGWGKSACDAFVEVQVRDQVKKTNVRDGTNNPIFDEKIFFNFKGMSVQDLDRSTITFNVYDKKRYSFKDALIGTFQLDWTNVYFKKNHQIYRGWLTLMDPTDETDGITGYLLVNVAVLGPDDKVTVHDSAFIKDPSTTMEDTITMDKLQLIDYGINIEVYRAQNLVPLDEFAGNVDAYVIAKFSANKIDTTVKTSCNPQWDQILRIGTAIPTKSKYVILQVRNKNYVLGDDIIGVIKIPFVDLKEESEPRWGHLYGPPVSGKDYPPYNFATKMQINGEKIGSHYRGRLLYKITGQKDLTNKNTRSKISFKFPFKPTPVVPLKSYTLRLQLLDGFGLPDVGQKNKCYIHASIGQYTIISKPFESSKTKSNELMQTIPDKKVQFPEDPTQIPDLIIYFARGEKQRNRISYVRIPAKTLVKVDASNPMTIYDLKGDLSLDNFQKDEPGGYITARAHLFSSVPPQKKHSLNYEFGKKTQFLARLFLYRGKNLPPMNETGDCDPKLDFQICGESKTVDPQQDNRTYNPIWNKEIDIEFEALDFMSIGIQRALICNVYDEQNSGKDNFIGNFMIKLSKTYKRKYQGLSKKVEFLYYKPRWNPIINDKVDIGDPCFGHVLMGCAIFRKSDMTQLKFNQNKKITEQVETKKFQFFILGVRDLQRQKSFLQNNELRLSIKVGLNKQVLTQNVQVKQNAANVSQMVRFSAEIPKNKSIIPYADIKVWESGKFIGFSSINLYDLIPKLCKKGQKGEGEGQQPQSDDSDTVVDLQELSKQLNIVKERKKAREQKQHMKNRIKDNVKVEQLNVPKQLPQSTTDEDRNQKLDELLDKFEKEYQNDPNYNFIEEKQSEKDLQMKEFMENISQSMKEGKNEENYKNSQEDQLLNFKSNMSYNRLKNMSGDIQKEVTEKQLSEKEESAFVKQSNMSRQKAKENQTKFSLLQSKINFKSRFNQKKTNRSRLLYEDKEIQEEKSVRDDYHDAKMRFQADSEKMSKKQIDPESEKGTLNDFEMDANEEVEEVQHDQRAIKYKDLERIIRAEERDTKQAMARQENYKYAATVKLSLFKWKNDKKKPPGQSYQDYDTDPEQSLDIIPQWYKGRKILAADFEELVPNKKIRTLDIYKGGNRIGNLDIRQKKKIGHIKCVGLAIDEHQIEQKEKRYLKLLKTKSYVCRVYVLKGKSLISDFGVKPTCYLRFTSKNHTVSLKDTLKREDYNPEFYVSQEIPMDIPGSSTVKIQVIETHSRFGRTEEKILGYTEIDIQERLFTKKWHLFTQKKPIQLRNLYTEYGNGTKGRLEVWTDIIEKKDWLLNPPYKIHPPPYDPFELRVIVYSTKQCVYKNQTLKSNDVFVRGSLGVSESQETDTHWACRGVGNFNYRFKFDVSYPVKPEDMYSDQFIIQIWDRNIIGYNNLIGQKRINLHKIHRIIEKAVKRGKAVKAKMKIKEKGLALTEKFWFDVYNHKMKDQFGQLQSQGKVQLSFELVPKTLAQKSLNNGFGRAEPNLYPTLTEPAGRLSFDLLHPLDFFKQLFGPELYNAFCKKISCCFIIILVVFLGYIIIGSLISSGISSGGSSSSATTTTTVQSSQGINPKNL